MFLVSYGSSSGIIGMGEILWEKIWLWAKELVQKYQNLAKFLIKKKMSVFTISVRLYLISQS